MLTINVLGHHVALADTAYIRLAAMLAPDYPGAAAAMLQKVIDTAGHTAEEVWQQFTHEIATVGESERYAGLWHEGRIRPLFAFLARHSHSVVTDPATGTWLYLGNSVELVPQAIEDHVTKLLQTSTPAGPQIEPAPDQTPAVANTPAAGQEGSSRLAWAGADHVTCPGPGI